MKKIKKVVTGMSVCVCLLGVSTITKAAQTDPIHKGWVEYTPDHVAKRAVGETTWITHYHYTRAQLVNPITGNVAHDSGRVYKLDYTKATTPWGGIGYSGKTYYGE